MAPNSFALAKELGRCLCVYVYKKCNQITRLCFLFNWNNIKISTFWSSFYFTIFIHNKYRAILNTRRKTNYQRKLSSSRAISITSCQLWSAHWCAINYFSGLFCLRASHPQGHPSQFDYEAAFCMSQPVNMHVDVFLPRTAIQPRVRQARDE